jgi:hypothetical protein
MAIDLQAKLQQSKLYFANLMDKYVDSYVFGISSDDCTSNKTEYAYFLIEAIEYQMEKGLGIDDPTTLEIYKKLDCITPINNTPVTIDESLLTPISNNPITGLVVYFNDILGSPYDNDALLAVLDSKAKLDGGNTFTGQQIINGGSPITNLLKINTQLETYGARFYFRNRSILSENESDFAIRTGVIDNEFLHFYEGTGERDDLTWAKTTGVFDFKQQPTLNGVPIGTGGNETTSNITADLTVGGIDAGDVVPAGTNIQELAELLLTTTFFPTFVNPTFSLGNNAGLRETGVTVTSFTLTFNYNRGQIVGALSGGIWNPSLFQDFRAGASSSYTINGTTQAGNTLAVSSYTVLNGSNTFSATVSYLTGPQPKDSKNVNYLTPYPSGTSASQSTSFTGLYPYFYYKSSSPITASSMQAAIAAGSTTKVVADSNGTITIPFAAGGEYLAVAYPSTSTTKSVWYVNALDNGSIPGGVFGAQTTLSCNSPESYWSGVSYKIHVSPGLITQANPIELRNS